MLHSAALPYREFVEVEGTEVETQQCEDNNGEERSREIWKVMLKHIVLERWREENRRMDKRGEGGRGER